MPPSEPSRVFISYARSDGSDFAAGLRKKFEKEHISLWQDVIRLHSGKDWWQQITNALDSVAYMVLMTAPECLRSEWCVLKGWTRSSRPVLTELGVFGGMNFCSEILNCER